MPERTLHEVGDCQVVVGGRRDDERVLARRLGVDAGATGVRGAPRREETRRVDRAGEQHGVDVAVRHERPADVTLVGANHLEDVGRRTTVGQRRPHRRHRDLGASGNRRCGLDDDGRSRGERGEHAADRDRHGEVPRRGHERQRGRCEASAVGARMPAGRFELDRPVGVVAGEVDRLGDLRVGLGHRLASFRSHDRHQLPATRLELVGGAAQDRGSLDRRSRRPNRAGRRERPRPHRRRRRWSRAPAS